MSGYEPISGQRILVTGATGFIGTRLCRRLAGLGAELYGVSREEQEGPDSIHTWYKGDLIDLEFARSTVNNSRPSMVFHLAGYAFGQRELKHVQPSYHNNVTTTVHMLQASTEAGIRRLILAGSMEEPEGGETLPLPLSPYAASKWAGTVYAGMFHKLYDTPVCIPRIFMVYGPGQHKDKLIPYVIRSLLNGQMPEIKSSDRSIDWIYLDDLVDGLIQMAMAGGIEGKLIDLGSGHAFTIREVCDKIRTQLDTPLHISYGDLPGLTYAPVRVADLSATERYLDWKPGITIDAGLKKTIDWVRSGRP